MVAVLGKLGPGINLDHQGRVSCSLALVEAVNNVIFHAHHQNADEWIDLNVDCNKGKIVFEIHDRGTGFVMPELDIPPLELTHGRGLFIINSLMSEVEYVRGKSNVLRMAYYV
jgi:anti-sigma regulatory factor (Ser/Thr protein kinase)